MEARFAKIEAHIEHILADLSALKADMRDIRERLAKIETRLYQLPTKDFVVTAAFVIIGIIGAIIALQRQIQGWIAPVRIVASIGTQACLELRGGLKGPTVLSNPGSG